MHTLNLNLLQIPYIFICNLSNWTSDTIATFSFFFTIYKTGQKLCGQVSLQKKGQKVILNGIQFLVHDSLYTVLQLQIIIQKSPIFSGYSSVKA